MSVNAASVSGFQFLRQCMDEKPDVLTRAIKNAMNAGGVVWKERANSGDKETMEGRWSNLDFLGHGKARSAWQDYWPQNRCRFSWDAIGRVQIGKVGWEWLLVSAFAHQGELEQNGNPLLDEADERVLSALAEGELKYNVDSDIDWINDHFYLSTRLSTLAFLRKCGICVRMLSVYFYDEKKGMDHLFPSLNQWDTAIATTEQELGLRGKSVLERRIYRIFLPARWN